MINFKDPYNHDDFVQLLTTLLPDFKEERENIQINRSYKHVKSINKIGSSRQLDLKVFEIEHESERDPRIALSRESFLLMKDFSVHKALVVFKNEKSSNYRLSLITFESRWESGTKIETKFSNPKRYSFFLGPSAKVNTPTKFLIGKGSVLDNADLKNRFSIEVVNKEFYKDISQSFTQLVSGKLKLPSNDEMSQTNLEFAVRLIGRIIFCWFLREKKSLAGLSLMPKDLLSLEAVNQNEDYYHKILEPIFFEVLNKPSKLRIDSFSKEPFTLIPFLNGGLFSPQYDDFYERVKQDFQSRYQNTLVIPDSWFRDFFEILETYNFTIDENTSYDEELSIDPEMLGRIFENLLAEINPETGESARKSTGSYYTPRTIVNYMIDESIFLYLKENTQIDEKKLWALISYDLNDDLENPISSEQKEKIIDALGKVKILDPACGSGAFPIGALQKIVFILQQTDPNGQLWFQKQINNTSPEIKKVIEREFGHKNFDYIRKLGIIRENIYGIDIQSIATEISRLRCFLTLIVDQTIEDDISEPIRGIEPLPNLEFKFVTANSLIELPENNKNAQTGLFEDTQNISKLSEIRNSYFNSTGEDRLELKNLFLQTQNSMLNLLRAEHRPTELTHKLATWEPFTHKTTPWFDPEWMFGIKDGFDIVIANPPYVGIKKNSSLFDPIRKSPLGKYFTGRSELFYFFFHLALDVCKDNSIVCFISTDYYPTATYGNLLRNDMKQRSAILSLIDFDELKIFESALGQHNMITILKKTEDKSYIARNAVTKRTGVANQDILNQIVEWNDVETNYYSITQNDIYDGPQNYIRPGGISGDSNQFNRITQKISRGEPLDTFCEVKQGLRTGADRVSRAHKKNYQINEEYGNGIFVLTDDEVAEMKLNTIEKELVKSFFKNSDISKYHSAASSNLNVLYINGQINEKDFKEKYPNIYKHLSKFKDLITDIRNKNNEDVKEWFHLDRPREEKIFISPKIIAPQRSKTNTFGYNEIDWYASADVYYILQKNKDVSLKYVLALLNSKLFYLWLYDKGKRKGNMLELYQKPLSEIPILKISDKEQEPFIAIVDKILDLTKSEDFLNDIEKQSKVKSYEKQIDQLVYSLYDLRPEEIKITEEL